MGDTIAKLLNDAWKATSDLSVYRRLSKAYLDNDQVDEQYKMFSLLSVSPRHKAPLVEAVISVECGIGTLFREEYATATRHFEHALAISHDDSCESIRIRGDSRYFLSYCYRIVNVSIANTESSSAIAEYSKLITNCAEFSKNPEIVSNLGELYLLQGMHDNGIRTISSIINIITNHKQKIRAMLTMSDLFAGKNNQTRADEWLSKSLGEASGDNRMLSIVHKQIGIFRYEKGNYEDSLAQMERALSHLEHDMYLRRNIIYRSEIYIYIGMDYYELGKHIAAADKLQLGLHGILSGHYLFPVAQLSLAHAYYSLGDFDKATTHYRIVVDSENASDKEKADASRYLTRIANPPLRQ